MKIKQFLFIALTLLLSVPSYVDASTKRYGIKSGYIKYKISGQNEGTEELYWDHYGAKEARHTNTRVSIFGATQEIESSSFLDGVWGYTLDAKTNTATKYNYKEMQRMTGQVPKDFSEEMMEAFGGVKIGSDSILGKTCDVYQMEKLADQKVCVYKGLALKTEARMTGFEFNMEAVEMEENVRIDQAKITLPEGVQVTEELNTAEMPSQEQIQEAMEQMKQLQNSPEYRQAMEQMQELKNNPEYQHTVQQMPGHQAQQNSGSMMERAGEIV